jgi:phage terminase small subunit
MIRGQKPKSAAEKRAIGNPGKRSLLTAVPAPNRGDLLCPTAVAGNPRAVAYWDMYLVNAAPGHLAPMDAPLLGRLCAALAFADEAHEKIAQTGLLVKAPNTGLPIQSPYLAVMNRQTEIARKLASELSIAPAQRNRTGSYGLEADTASPWDILKLGGQ